MDVIGVFWAPSTGSDDRDIRRVDHTYCHTPVAKQADGIAWAPLVSNSTVFCLVRPRPPSDVCPSLVALSQRHTFS